jgi:hypothetical protein
MLTLNSLWVGSELGYVERLCLKSALVVGHKFNLYSYDSAVQNVPDGVTVRDAREVMPESRLLRYADSGAVQLGANLFRYELMKLNRGAWVDMDFCFLRNIGEGDPYLFGWEYENWINNAVLLSPADSNLTSDLCELPRDNRRPPWFGPKRTVLYYLRRLRGDVRVQDLPWGTFSSGMLTYLVNRYGLQKYARDPEVYYPIRWKDARVVFGSAADARAMITPKTRAVHFWSSRISELSRRPPPVGSYMYELCREFDVQF